MEKKEKNGKKWGKRKKMGNKGKNGEKKIRPKK